jgi:hypothetical protein
MSICLYHLAQLPQFSVVAALQAHRCADLATALSAPLEFRIPTIEPELVSRYGDIFQLADSEYKYDVESFLKGTSIGGGTSEIGTIIANSGWLNLIHLSVGGVIPYLNEKDASSLVSLRRGVVLYRNGALFLRIEQKASQHHLMVAREELVDKLSKDAWSVFPRGTRSIIGLASAGKLIDMVIITHVDDTQYSCHLHSHFSVETMGGRVDFLVALVKFLRYVATIDGPNSSFHLVPGIRLRTANGHHVTWARDGLLKEYKHLQSPKHIIWIKEIYEAKLDHVEHGIVQDMKRSVVLVQRIGRQLKGCIIDGTVSKESAYHQIAMGVEELHRIGFAHCDICVSNCSVDVSGPTPVVFLNDLEYVRLVDMPPPPPPPPHNSRLSEGDCTTA